MAKSYIKKKEGPKKVPGYRTPKTFRGKVFGNQRPKSQAAIKPLSFKTQHRG